MKLYKKNTRVDQAHSKQLDRNVNWCIMGAMAIAGNLFNDVMAIAGNLFDDAMAIAGNLFDDVMAIAGNLLMTS